MFGLVFPLSVIDKKLRRSLSGTAMRVDVRLIDATDIVGLSETPANAFRRKHGLTVCP
jgi:hypothetical protein